MRFQMRRKKFYIFLILIMTSFMINNLFAQRDQLIIREFNELKVYLTKIWVVVQRFDNVKARELMQQAKQELDTADDLIFNQNRYILAKVHMVMARALANQAAKLVLNQPVERLKKQLDDLINKAEKVLSNNQSDESRYLLNQAKKFRNLAYNALANGRFNKAQEYYRIAFYFADKSIKLINRRDEDTGSQIAELMSNIDQLFIQAEDLINENNRYKNLLNEARKHYSDALQLLENGRINLARNKLLLIEKLLFRIMDQIDRLSLNNNDRIKNDFYSLKAFLDALEQDAEESGNDRVEKFLQQAKKLYSEASQAFDAGRMKLVQTKLNLSQRFASKALQFMNSNLTGDLPNIESKINDNKNLLQLQKPHIDNSKNNALNRMFQEAERLNSQASEFYNQNKYRAALRSVQLSTRLINKIQRYLDYGSNEEDLKVNEIEQKINRAGSLLNKLKNNNQINDEYKDNIQKLEDLFVQATNYFEAKDYQLANEYIDFVLQQIEKQLEELSKQTK